ncbi:hypothetical protein HMPREF0724_14169 [Prescottella equi ATCC 33707]|uniref:Uncharacterized protein n=1 Tax=Prescottella equi ATCC 33707 TaxID=525370 RepID=E9T5W3_RHOHA|nr:hypothetical protein HMPREF0724_14169 [Prescottella equi ATCC 33707]
MERRPRETTYRRLGSRGVSGPRSRELLAAGCRPRANGADTGELAPPRNPGTALEDESE